VGHGSKAAGFDTAMKRVLRDLGRAGARARCAYLEINPPSIPEAIRRAVVSGAREIRVLPYFLLSGRHIRRDIPRLVTAARRRWKGKARILLCPYLGYDKRIVEVVKDRLRHV
jgi:sirohydrochlorin ferrochelatase